MPLFVKEAIIERYRELVKMFWKDSFDTEVSDAMARIEAQYPELSSRLGDIFLDPYNKSN